MAGPLRLARGTERFFRGQGEQMGNGAEVATAFADRLLANPAQLKIVTSLRARTGAATRCTLIAHHGDERGSAAARGVALQAWSYRLPVSTAGGCLPGRC